MVIQILLLSDLDNACFNFIDYTKKYSNGLTLIEYCYYNNYTEILDFVYRTKLKYIYKNE